MKKIMILLLILVMMFTGCSAAKINMLDERAESDDVFSQIEVTELGGADANKAEVDSKPAKNVYASSIEKVYFTDADGKAAFNIVYPEKTIEIIHDAAEVLRTALKKATGEDFKKHSDATDATDDTYEILIGDTNRSQSKHNLKEKEYMIKVDGNKIVIVGGSYYATAVAVSEFKSLFSKTVPYVKKNLSLKSSVNTLYRVAVSNSGESSVDIYEITPLNTAPTLVKRFYNVGATGINFRWTEKYGEVIVCASGKIAKVIDYDTGKEVWKRTDVANGAHGAELLPNGVVAVASSSTDTVSFFNMNGTAKKTVTLDDAHAVLWDPKYQVVWALGYTEMRAYKVTVNSSGAITVTEDQSKRSPFNNTGGHDLAPVYYNKDKMWVSAFGKVYIYDKTNKTYSDVIPGDNGIMGVRRVKGLGNFTDGSMITTYPDEASTSLYTWTTEKLNFYFMYEGKLYYTPVYTPKMHYYKVRIVCTDYQ